MDQSKRAAQPEKGRRGAAARRNKVACLSMPRCRGRVRNCRSQLLPQRPPRPREEEGDCAGLMRCAPRCVKGQQSPTAHACREMTSPAWRLRLPVVCGCGANSAQSRPAAAQRPRGRAHNSGWEEGGREEGTSDDEGVREGRSVCGLAAPPWRCALWLCRQIQTRQGRGGATRTAGEGRKTGRSSCIGLSLSCASLIGTVTAGRLSWDVASRRLLCRLSCKESVGSRSLGGDAVPAR
jgi:hypothetical protein